MLYKKENSRLLLQKLTIRAPVTISVIHIFNKQLVGILL